MHLLALVASTLGGVVVGWLASRSGRRSSDPEAMKEQLFKVRSELEEQLRRSEALPGMLVGLSSVQDVEKLYDNMTRMAREYLSADFSLLMLKRDNEFCVVGSEGVSAETRANLRLPIKTGLIQYLVETGKPVRIGKGDRQLQPLRKYGDNVNEAMVAPLRNATEVFGLLVLGRQSPGPFWTGSDVNLLSYMSIPFSLAAHSGAAFQQHQQTALHALTAIAEQIEERDPFFRGKSTRVTDLCLKIGNELRMSERDLESLRVAGLLHDIGTLSVPGDIIYKDGKLTEEEMALVQEHPKRALDLLQPLGFLDRSLPMILYHHERFDGAGYPYALKGSSIPVGAALIGMCEVWDALTRKRPHRDAFSVEQASKIMNEMSGTHFDPKLLRMFLNIIERHGKTTQRIPVSP